MIRKVPDQTIVHAAGDIYRFLATAEDTNGAYALLHAIIPPGGGPPFHVHSKEDERFDILKGTLRFRVGHDELDAEPGDSLFASRGTPHAFNNLTDQPAEMLIHFTPGGMEQMFLEFGRVVESLDALPEPMGEQQIRRITEVTSRFGIEVLGPPIGGAH
jgi:mannose-6-phosphate isomerase-like protein (cupin superfamily)